MLRKPEDYRFMLAARDDGAANIQRVQGLFFSIEAALPQLDPFERT